MAHFRSEALVLSNRVAEIARARAGYMSAEVTLYGDTARGDDAFASGTAFLYASDDRRVGASAGLGGRCVNFYAGDGSHFDLFFESEDDAIRVLAEALSAAIDRAERKGLV